jgi:hypothetical protein
MQRLSAVRCEIPYQEQDLTLDPYTFGLWLGDGSQRDFNITTADQEIAKFLVKHPMYDGYYEQPVKEGRKTLIDVRLKGAKGGRAVLRELGVWKNKHIPSIYKTSSIDQRMQLLAGLMDSDGWVDHGSSVITMARKELIQDIAEVSRSLGFRTALSQKTTNFDTLAYTVCISNTIQLPTLLSRRTTVCSNKGDLMTVVPLGMGTYYGITVDGDSRYCSAEYIALRNTGKQGACDNILMLGSSEDPMIMNTRGISMAKEKIKRAGEDHLQGEVLFDADIGRYIEG